ncbi:centriole and centriolar satellite protein ofd1-like isoform X2 [Lethenteron reissneri]|nr:centriole and centriolar satellite protein ofd1-like isoform X2 [Lethenteron reissneri]XP_061403722.1 centriole and centriolar satellite protein ofd1-like isoform X2 [Lethenteron reissneri]
METPRGVRGSSRELESQAELRERLYSAFKSRGLLTALKTHVRDRVVRELRCPGEWKAPPGLVESVALSLVAQHLGATACDYSLCLLYPESGLQPHAVLKPEEVLRVLGLSSERWAARTTAAAAAAVGSAGGSHPSLLLWLLEELSERASGSGVRDEETQTSPEERAWGETLGERLRCIDREFSAAVRDPKGAVGSGLHRLELQVERRVREEVDTRVRELTEREAVQSQRRGGGGGGERQQQQEQQLQQQQRHRREELEWSHAASSKLWRQRQEDEERALYQERQTLLREAETLRAREAQHQLHVQNTDTALSERERRVQSAEGRLGEREAAAIALEETFSLRLQQHKLAHEVKVQQEFQERNLRLAQREERLAASDRETQKQLQQLQEARSTITHLQAELAEAREAVQTATRKGEETIAVATRRGEEAVAVATRRGEEAVAVATRRWEEEREGLRGAVLRLETELNAAREETSRQRLARQRDSDSQVERMSTLRKELRLQQEHNQLLERQITLTAGGPRSPPPPPPPPPRLARSPSPDFLAESQRRVRQLELQALSLEDAYRRCATNATATATSFAQTERGHHLHRHQHHQRTTSVWTGRGGGRWDLGLGARAEGVGGERRGEERDTGMAAAWLERDETGIGTWTTGTERERGLEMDRIVMGRHNTGTERETWRERDMGLDGQTGTERETSGPERETWRQRDRETWRQTGLDRDKGLDGQTGRERETVIERETWRERDMGLDGQTGVERETWRQTGRERDKGLDGQTGRERQAGIERQEPGLQTRMEMHGWDTDDAAQAQGNVGLGTRGQEGRHGRERERRSVEIDGEGEEVVEVEEVVEEVEVEEVVEEVEEEEVEDIRMDCPITPGGGENQRSLDQSERSDRHDHIQSRRDQSDGVVRLAVDQSDRSIRVDGDQADGGPHNAGDRLDGAEPPALDQSGGSSRAADTEMRGGSSSSGPQPLAEASADLGVAQTLPESEVMNTYLQMVRGESQTPPPPGGLGSLSVGSEAVVSRDSVDTASHGDDDFW